MPPDTQTLVNAANLYPFLIQSDQIARYRESLYGMTPGTLTALAHNASTNTYGVYHPSPLPIIDVTAKAKLASNPSHPSDDADAWREAMAASTGEPDDPTEVTLSNHLDAMRGDPIVA